MATLLLCGWLKKKRYCLPLRLKSNESFPWGSMYKKYGYVQWPGAPDGAITIIGTERANGTEPLHVSIDTQILSDGTAPQNHPSI